MERNRVPVFLLLLFGFLILSLRLQAQQQPCHPDMATTSVGVQISINVLANDVPGFMVTGIPVPPANGTAFIDPVSGMIWYRPDSAFCGKDMFYYEGMDAAGQFCETLVTIDITCEKPNCNIVDLSGYGGGGGTPGGMGDCVYACENSAATYYVTPTSGHIYTWTILGGAATSPNGLPSIDVYWGPIGPASIKVVHKNGAGVPLDSMVVCVTLLPAPVASFTTADICLGQTAYFTNTSTGGVSYFWDFGDGGTYNGSTPPGWMYGAAGTYTVTLVATNTNSDPQGNPLCCCSDTFSTVINVDPLPGPDIECISTLCAYETETYSTNANCTSYMWSILGGTGTIVGPNNMSQVTVNWGPGPVGILQLTVSGCATLYCPTPSIAYIPIIPTTVSINGPNVVCQGAQEVYSVPKFQGTAYTWTVTGGTIASGQGTPEITVDWGYGTSGTVQVNYYNQFLGCGGSGLLNVLIRPQFFVSGPTEACVGDNSIYSAFPAGGGSGFTWSVTGGSFSPGPGADNITVTWNAGPGNYTVSAMPNNPSDFCNSSATVLVQVTTVASPDSITGPVLVCPNGNYLYEGHTSTSNTTLNWVITNGSPTPASGPVTNVMWGGTGPFVVGLYQSMNGSPFCNSDTIYLNVASFGTPVITGDSVVCANETVTYSVPNIVGETYNWTVTPANAGSVVSGQGTNQVTVQWNSYSGSASINITVCGNTTGEPVLVNPEPLISVSAPASICPGGSAVVSTNYPSATHQWKDDNNVVLSNLPTVTITQPGYYYVSVTDANGCTGDTIFNIASKPVPTASISTPDDQTICTQLPHNVTMHALVGGGYSYKWYCNGVLQGPTASTFTHIGTTSTASFSYYVVVTNTAGCTDTSNTIVVNQLFCTGGGGGGGGCVANGNVSFLINPPICNVVELINTSVNGSNFTWYFGDGGSLFQPTLTNPTYHTYTQAGFYLIKLFGDVDTCYYSHQLAVEIPVAANFNFGSACAGSQICFNDLSTHTTNFNITGWAWDFGDPPSGSMNTSTLANPCHTYNTPGSYTVMLTVTAMNSMGDMCQVTISKTVEVFAPPVAAIIAPDTACLGTQVPFVDGSTGAFLTGWNWNFGDGSGSTAQNPLHAYSPTPGNFIVTLIVGNVKGCKDTATHAIHILTPPPPGSISPAGPVTICKGNFVVLTAPLGVSYLWSTGATTDTIHAYNNGNYTVTVTDSDGCVYTTAPVSVIVNPLPPATISGPSKICDGQCITLSGPSGPYTYQWFDNSGPIAGEINQMTSPICWNTANGPYMLEVTDPATGCMATSALFPVTVYPLPVTPIIAANQPTPLCAGVATTLSVTNIQPAVSYFWNNGASGPSITTSAAGTYTVTALDTNGCAASASIIINPLPDLCIVPTGCYTRCLPDTLYGPPGYPAYQWFFNGNPIAAGMGGTADSLIVNLSGIYNLAVTNSFGCSDTSADLDLMMVPCDSTCDSLNLAANFNYTLNGTTLTLTDASTGTGINFVNWYFGDGGTATTFPGATVNHTFAGNGTYVVCLTIISLQANNVCCKDSICIPIVVEADTCDYYHANFNYTISALNVHFTDASVPGSTYALWYFGDGDSAIVQGSGQMISHSYATWGKKDVCMVSVSHIDSIICCIDTICKRINIKKPWIFPNFRMTGYPNPVNDQLTLEYRLEEGDDRDPIEIRVFDTRGRILLKQMDEHSEGFSTLDMSGFAPGIYMVEVKARSFQETHKFIKE
jgi:PKD repeat protein